MPANVTVNVTGSPTKYDAAQIVVSDVGGIVMTQDVTLTGAAVPVVLALPAGTYSSQLGGTAVYTVSVRAWKRSSQAATLQWARAASVVDLRSADSATVAVTLP